MAGGISSGPSAPIRKIGNEWPQILELFNSDFRGPNNQFDRFVQNQPLLTGATNLALGSAAGEPRLESALRGDITQLGDLSTGLGGLSTELGGLIPGFNSDIGSLGRERNQLQGLVAPLRQTLRTQIDPILHSGGALTPEQIRDVSLQTQDVLGSRGQATGNADLGAQLMNRQSAQQQRYDTALNESNLVGGEISGITGQEAGITQAMGGLRQAESGIIGQQAGIAGQRAGITQGEAGLTQGIQGLQTGAINQLLGVESSNVGNFTSLQNPLLQFASNLFTGNQGAQFAQNQANTNKGAGLVGGGVSGAGSILTSILPLLFASDQRLKEKIKDLGEKTAQGIPIKSFQFKGDPNKQRFIGVIAQDVEKKVPEAVHTHPSGFKMIDRRMIGAPYFAIGHGEGGDGGGWRMANINRAFRGLRPMGMSSREGAVGERGEPLGRDAFPSWYTSPRGQGPANVPYGQQPPGGIDPTIEPTPLPGTGDPGSGPGGGNPSTTASGGDPFEGGGNPFEGLPGDPFGATIDPTSYDPQGYPYALPVFPDDFSGGDLLHLLING